MKQRIFYFVLISLLLLTAGCQAAPTSTTTPPQATSVPAGQEASLTITGPKETKTLSLDDLKKMPPTIGLAGMKSSTGKIFPPATYKGILLLDLLTLVGGADSNMGVQVTAKDGYAMTFSVDQIKNGDFVTYDPGTGDENKNVGRLQVLIAYEMEGKPIDPKTDGPLRLVVIGEKPNQVTDGHWSEKFVQEITLKPLAEEWTLHLMGAMKEPMDRATFESGAAEKCHKTIWKDDKAQEWMGIPLWLLVGRVDDDKKHDTGAYNDALADKGYTIDVVGKDGYTATFDSARVKRNNNIIVAYLMNGNPLTDKDFPLRLVGSDVSKKEGVGGIEKIVLNMQPKTTSTESTAPAATAVPAQSGSTSNGTALIIIGLVGKEQALSMDDLKNMDVIKETVTHPKKGQMDAEGVRLHALLDLAGPKPEAKSLVITAKDGFMAELDMAKVNDCKTCLVAFDGQGGLKTVMPDMPGNLWVSNVIKIEVK